MPGDDRDQISLVVGDDHRMLTDLLKIVIDDDPDVRLVADPVDNAKDAIELCARYRPDVVLMDIQLRGELNGVDATKLIRRVSPSTKVIIMSGSYSYEAALLKVAEAGACGFLDKADAAEDVVGAVKAAAAGESSSSRTSSTGFCTSCGKTGSRSAAPRCFSVVSPTVSGKSFSFWPMAREARTSPGSFTSASTP